MGDSIDIGALARKELRFPIETSTFKCHSGQTAEIKTEFRAIMAKADANSPVVFWVSAENSHASPGQMKYNRHDKKGEFQDRIEVEFIVLCEISPGSGNWHKVPDFSGVSDSPPAYSGTGSFSNSVSFSFSESFSGGFFGKDGTATGSVSASVSETSSFGHSIADFEIKNLTSGLHVWHQYLMRESDGGPYKQPADLIAGATSFPGPKTFYSGAQAYDPCMMATCNLPILSQAVWQNNHGNDYVDFDVKVIVTIAQHLIDVEGTNTVFSGIKASVGQETHIVHRELLIPLSKLKDFERTSI